MMGNRFVKLLRSMRPQARVPHVCWTCGWRVLSETPPRNRVCRGPPIKNREEILKHQHGCIHWKLEPDPEKRIRSFI